MVEIINWLLIHGGEAVLWLSDSLKSIFGAIFSALDSILNPILSPLLSFLNPIATWLGDIVFAPLRIFSPAFTISFLSAALGALMLLAFRHTSNQAAITRAKDQIKANLLAMKLFKDELHVTFRSQWRILKAIVRLQACVLFPVLIMALPMMLCLGQMALRYQWRPIAVGERVLLKLFVNPSVIGTVRASIAPHPGIGVELGPIAGKSDLVWRLKGVQPGRHTIDITVNGEHVEKEVVVGDPFARVSELRPGHHWVDQLLHPAERQLPSNSIARRIEVLYPSDIHSWIYGPDHWVIYFFVVSMLTALALAPVFKVRF
ncbi:MAG: hypothetical protein HY287_10640 [Planctomycetes bacterium]|nr:hypothetical protein [Planctomycetota bacterium]